MTLSPNCGVVCHFLLFSNIPYCLHIVTLSYVCLVSIHFFFFLSPIFASFLFFFVKSTSGTERIHHTEFCAPWPPASGPLPRLQGSPSLYNPDSSLTEVLGSLTDCLTDWLPDCLSVAECSVQGAEITRCISHALPGWTRSRLAWTHLPNSVIVPADSVTPTPRVLSTLQHRKTNPAFTLLYTNSTPRTCLCLSCVRTFRYTSTTHSITRLPFRPPALDPSGLLSSTSAAHSKISGSFLLQQTTTNPSLDIYLAVIS